MVICAGAWFWIAAEFEGYRMNLSRDTGTDKVSCFVDIDWRLPLVSQTSRGF